MDLKTCRTCGISKPLDEFYVRRPKDRPRTYYHSYCKPCCSARNTSEKSRRAHLRMKYGLSLEAYDDLLRAQGGVCAICEGPCPTGNFLAVDHCHESGRIRGLLCANCNTALGKFRDRPDLMKRAIDYLESA